jgi:putative DNA primase/helicase
LDPGRGKTDQIDDDSDDGPSAAERLASDSPTAVVDRDDDSDDTTSELEQSTNEQSESSDDVRSFIERVKSNPEEWLDPDKRAWTVPDEPDRDELETALETGEKSEEVGKLLLGGGLDEEVESALVDYRNNPDEWSVETGEPELSLVAVANRLGVAPGDLQEETTSAEKASAFWELNKETETLPVIARQSDDKIFCWDSDTGVWDEGDLLLRALAMETLSSTASKQVLRELMSRVRSDLAAYYDDDLDGFGPVPQDEIGTPDGWIPVENGDLRFTVDGRERDLVEPEPVRDGSHITNRLPVEYDPDADCPQFLEFYRETIGSEDSAQGPDKKKVQEYIGYCLLSWGLPFHKSLFLIGPQASGKSTLLSVVRQLLGSENVASAEPKAIADDTHTSYELLGKWANIDADLNSNNIENAGTWKKLASGDQMKLEQKYEDPIFKSLNTKQLYAANQLPTADVDDDSFYRRVMLASAPTSTPKEEREEGLSDRLVDEESSGILNWFLDGLDRLLRQNGFTRDRTPFDTREHWERYSGSIERFIQEVCETPPTADPSSKVERTEAYDRYQEYAESRGLPAESRRKTYRKLRKTDNVSDERRRIKGRSINVFCGLEIDEVDPDAERSDGQSGLDI